jgi:Uncharacterized protein conserved in bacteria
MKFVKDQISPHFSLHEFSNSEDGDTMLLDEDVIFFITVMLEEFRAWYSRPMNINSGYRTAAYNKRIGGVSNSYHLKALAVDYSLPVEFHGFSKARQQEFLDNVKTKWYDICRKHGKFGNVMYHNTFVHMSLWPTWYFEDKRG